MTESNDVTNHAAPRRGRGTALLLASVLLAACGGSGGGGGNGDGGGNGGGDVVGDDARRAVLADIGDDIIVPALEDFATEAAELQTAVAAHADAPADDAARTAAQDAWREAMTSWQYNEVLQVGPAGLSGDALDMTPGGKDLRGYIYAFPLLSPCTVEQLAADDADATRGSPSDTIGLGALEQLLFREQPHPDCSPSPAPTAAQRAAYALEVADLILDVANELENDWQPGGGDFLSEWSNAGDGSTVYARPQDALDALSVALFYAEKDTKDDKVADPTGIGATGLDPCDPVPCPERLESRLSGHSGENIRANIQAFRDVFTGIDGGRGLNELLRGVGRDDLADQIAAETADVLEHLDTEITPDFETAIENIDNETECINASAEPEGVGPAACELHGFLTRAMNTFRGDINSALSLATPNRAEGDND